MNDFNDNSDNFNNFNISNNKYHVETPEETAARVSRKQLENFAVDLHGRDQAILNTLYNSRLMTSGQISRQHFEPDHANPNAAQRAANRTMNRLQNHGLITSLNRKVGGISGGSAGFVWELTQPGTRLVNLGLDDQSRKRNFEPSQHFIKHTLGVSELNVQLLGIDDIGVVNVQFEPNCWRTYHGSTLKPDLYAVTSDGEYEDSWFFELDLATEAPSRIVSKCEQYQDYYRSGIEQSDYGVFPAVVWIVPDSKRKASLQSHVAQNAALLNNDIFVFILPDELEPLIRRGAGQ